MKRTIVFILAALMTLSTAVVAQDRRAPARRGAAPGANPEAAAQKDTAKAKPLSVKNGLYGVAKSENDWFFEIPDSLLGRRILAVTRYVTNTVDAGVYGGEEINEAMIYWEKAPTGNLLLRADVLSIKADSTQAIYKAVKASSENPIVASFKPEKNSPAGVTRIKVNSLFESDTQVFSFDSRTKRQYNLGGLNRDATFITSIRTYPINTEVTVTKTYSYNAPQPTGQAGARMAQRSLPAGSVAGAVTLQMNTSFVLLPKVPMQPRLFDSRVGYFADSWTEFKDDQQSVEATTFIARYRLEARPEDVEKQKRGELVEPIKPIVYYIDPATPKQWRKHLIAGVNDWNVAFEQAGWKNAIHAEEWPEDNPDMSLEDARFCVIRYLASPTQNAYGPNVHDPRSGEIIESHVGWYHNVMSLVHDWYQIQAGAVDPRARKMKFDDELMGDLIRFVSSHEVGHTLGLRHNKGASFMTPVEKLRDKAWVEANGHTVSIMDYARFNYVAQPEDNISKEGLYPRVGAYDKWAIEYGYKPTYINDIKKDHLYWNKVIIDTLAANPRLWFGGEGYDEDPRAQSEDLGDNSVKASEYGIKNLKVVLASIPEWNKEEGDQYRNISRMYQNVISQFNRYAGHVAANIGGRYITYKSIEQEGPVYEPVPKGRQVEALGYINDNIFTRPSWLVDVPFMDALTDTPDSYLRTGVSSVMTTLLSPSRLNRMVQFYQKDRSNYDPEEYLDDVVDMIFSDTTPDSYTAYVQNRFVTVALQNATAANVTDASNLLVEKLCDVYKIAKKQKSGHWKSIASRIKKELDL